MFEFVLVVVVLSVVFLLAVVSSGAAIVSFEVKLASVSATAALAIADVLALKVVFAWRSVSRHSLPTTKAKTTFRARQRHLARRLCDRNRARLRESTFELAPTV